MIPPLTLTVDSRNAAQFVQELRRQRPGFVPEWLPGDAGADAAILQIAARYLQATAWRLNHAPNKNKLAFFEMLGFQLLPARPSRAPMVFRLNDNAADLHLPAGTRVGAPPPPGSSNQIIFETETPGGLSTAKLQQVFSFWPGRDQYIDHSDASQAGQPFQLFLKSALQNGPHALYLGHDTLLALAGTSQVLVHCELTVPGTAPLDIVWEYWDGQIWREFLFMRPQCSDETVAKPDTTAGLTRRSGSFTLKTDGATTAKTTVNGINTFWVRGRLTAPLVPDASRILPQVDSIKLATQMSQPTALKLDKAFADQAAVDLTKAFYPFGQQPQAGAAFYFTNQEVFSKPGATVYLSVTRVKTPQDTAVAQMNPNPPSSAAFPEYLAHDFAWEYWNGTDWTEITVQITSTNDLLAVPDASNNFATAKVQWTAPSDFESTKVNGDDGLWMRIRLKSGGFGVVQQIALNGGGTFNFTIADPPAVSAFLLGYDWTNSAPVPAGYVLAHNDFQFEDDTEAAKWPGNAFQPFQAVHETSPALYLGFTAALPVDQLGICFDILEQSGDTEGPILVWDYWNGGSWLPIVVKDETQNLRLPGLVSFIGPDDSAPLDRFGTPLYWLRARLKEDGPPGEPTINGIYSNAVWALQNQTIVNEPIAASTGQPNQVFAFRQMPVLEGEIVEVRESAGARANIEWRIIALEVFQGDQTELAKLDAMLQADGPETDLTEGAVSLTRDRTKRVTEVWVTWAGKLDFFLSGPNDRHYVVERARGRIYLGDGHNGAIPPAGAAINAQVYRSGGGQAGNIAAHQITQLLGPVGGIEETFNPLPAEGGADGESPNAVAQRCPPLIRCRGRALLPEDFEALARAANASVAVARALPCDPGGHTVPGWVTVVIIPQSPDPQPMPTFGLRQEVQSFIAQYATMDLVDADRIYVTGPTYIPIDVRATMVPLPAADAGAVEQDAKTALGNFLSPLRGGPDGHGWPPGRAVFASDIATVLDCVNGVDYVAELELSRNGVLQRDAVAISADGVVVAGNFQLKLLEPVT
jgi:Baseplate J-like protein